MFAILTICEINTINGGCYTLMDLQYLQWLGWIQRRRERKHGKVWGAPAGYGER